MDALTEVETRYDMKFPTGYRKWVERGYIDCDPMSCDYLWVQDAEWIPLRELPKMHEVVHRVSIPGLVPFAFNAAGDNWCFSTQFPTSSGEYEIWFCPHDDDIASPDSPTFNGWFYRRCLDFASGRFDKAPEEIENAQGNLLYWAERLSEIDDGPWPQHLSELGNSEALEYRVPGLEQLAESLLNRKSPIAKLVANIDSTRVGFLTETNVNEIAREQFGVRYVESSVRWHR